MTETPKLTAEIINKWADDTRGPVALHLKQALQPVEVEGRVIYPPTYADIGYNIDTLSDGTRVALIDSVGSQANRMEPIFKDKPYSCLVPKIEIEFHSDGEGDEQHIERRSLLDLAHRSADAVVHASPSLSKIVKPAFHALKQRGDAGPLCRIAPTSLIFGVWDSRGESNEKRPRLIRSIIRAWDVEPLHAAAQFNSVWKALNDDQRKELKTKAKEQKVKLSEKGFADAPAIFRKTSRRIPQLMQNDVLNQELRVLGGVLVRGHIERDITVNLVALRKLHGESPKETEFIRRYLLSLTLIAATKDMDLFLREGCHLRFLGDDRWNAVPRRGDPVPVDLASKKAHEILLDYAQEAVKPFEKHWPKEEKHEFNMAAAKDLLKKSPEEGEMD